MVINARNRFLARREYISPVKQINPLKKSWDEYEGMYD
ncbi:Uncharacterized protein dnl_09670 [Desulfonema limicola]|uniref:Uncharacterized protein n=1 Tax=Desulfonema limicola TaxID=45656 RepID=A0A975GF23_9BACT|nr:Uncharacterized protein dnl_09670 [Desulfonema limicola]